MKVSAKGVWEAQHLRCLPDGESRGFRYSLFYYAGRELPGCSEAQVNAPTLQAPNHGPDDQKVNGAK